LRAKLITVEKTAVLADAGGLDWEMVAERVVIVQGRILGRQSDRDITLFKSLGITLEKLVFGKLIYDSAITAGVGQKLDLDT
jgi:ornithine cyclodeaminase/alanine dehydrogenase-like protein (mu-crystallin family)